MDKCFFLDRHIYHNLTDIIYQEPDKGVDWGTGRVKFDQKHYITRKGKKNTKLQPQIILIQNYAYIYAYTVRSACYRGS
jgi:hypothetical protein